MTETKGRGLARKRSVLFMMRYASILKQIVSGRRVEAFLVDSHKGEPLVMPEHAFVGAALTNHGDRCMSEPAIQPQVLPRRELRRVKGRTGRSCAR